MRRMINVTLCIGLALSAARLIATADIKDLDGKWIKAMKDGDIAAVIALYDENAVLYPADAAPLKGSKAIGQYFAEFFAKYRVKDIRMSDTGHETEDDLSVSWGRFALTLQPQAGGAEQTIEGRFTGIARKKDGVWRYVADHASAMPAAPK